jgi:hypothetical protein
MAERIGDLPENTRGRPRTYPWHEWMDGRAWKIVAGEDFNVPPASMAAMIRQRSSGSAVASTRIVDDGQAVEFQFHSRR